MPLDMREVLQACDWLENDYTSGGLDYEHREYEKIYQLNHVPRLSDELSRGRTIVYPIPRLSEWLGNVINQVLGYSTFPVLTSLGSDLTPSEADKLEAALSLILAECNEGQALISDAYRGFLKNTHVVYQVVPGAYGAQTPFEITLPDITTVFFERFKGGQPPMCSRSYDMLVRDAETKYSGKRGEHDGNGQQATYDSIAKRFRYTPLSQEWPHGQADGARGRGDLGELVHIKEFYDDAWCYHVMYGKDAKDASAEGQVVLKQPSVTHGPPFIIVPSNPQAALLWREDWRPIGWSLYTRILQIERIETIRATRAEHVQEHVIRRLPPEDADALDRIRKQGITPVLHGGVNFIDLPAEEVLFWTQMPDADLKERSIELKNEMERWISSWLLPATEEVIKAANVGTYQIGAAAVHAQESTLLSKHTRGLAGCAEMILHALSQDYAADRSFYARDETQYGRLGAKKVAPGASISVSAETLRKVKVYGADANVRIEVITRSETESELEQREAGVWNNVQRGSQTFDEFIAVRNPDVAGQHEALAKDGVRKALAAVYDAAIPMIAAKRNLERWGVDVDRLMQPAPPMQTQGAPGGGTTVMQAPPASNGVDVSSRGGAMSAGAMQ